MTKKHLIALAAALLDIERDKATLPQGRDECAAIIGWRMTVQDVANVFAQTNDRFDRARFLAACGLEG